ncbi:MAG: Hsp20/alpha crystallin family protein [Anaerolineae bacterium]|jgi:HSP20 family protein
MPITDLIPWKREEKRVPIRRTSEDTTSLMPRDFDRMFDAFFRGFGLMPSRAFGENWEAFSPQIDVVEDEDEIRVSAELPGMDEDEIDVSLSRGTLTIQGEKREETEDRGRNYYRMERSYGTFRRSIPLPSTVDESAAEATYEKGVLTISLPKKEEARAGRRIPIRTG